MQEDAEDLIDDRDVEIPDANTAPLNYRRINREEDNAQEEDILRRIEERYKDYQVHCRLAGWLICWLYCRCGGMGHVKLGRTRTLCGRAGAKRPSAAVLPSRMGQQL